VSRRALGAATLAGLVVTAAGCPGGETCAPVWQEAVARADLDRPILSLWGTGDTLYGVGGGVGDAARRALVLRRAAGRWDTLDPGHDETLWWVWGTADGRAVWMVGEDGLALRWDGAAFEVLPRLTGATLFGVWGSGPDDVWLCGGTPGGGTGADNDVVLHWDGQRLSPAGPPATGAAFFKVWGSGPDDVWVVGEGGTIWQRTAAGWRRHDAPGRDALTTVHGCGADEIYAVGGMAVYRYDGAAWAKDETATPLAAANGVHCGRDEVLVVGNGGLKLRRPRGAAAWIDESFAAPYYADLHVAFADAAGDLWAAGGNYNAPPSVGREGLLARFGCP
jgi:hypothetical protein